MGQGFDAMRAGARGSKGKARTLGETGVGGSGGSTSAPMDEDMRRILDGLTKVREDERAVDGVLVS